MRWNYTCFGYVCIVHNGNLWMENDFLWSSNYRNIMTKSALIEWICLTLAFFVQLRTLVVLYIYKCKFKFVQNRLRKRLWVFYQISRTSKWGIGKCLWTWVFVHFSSVLMALRDSIPAFMRVWWTTGDNWVLGKTQRPGVLGKIRWL